MKDIIKYLQVVFVLFRRRDNLEYLNFSKNFKLQIQTRKLNAPVSTLSTSAVFQPYRGGQF